MFGRKKENNGNGIPEELGTDVLGGNVSRETLSEYEELNRRDPKKKAQLDKFREKGNITDDNPYDFNNPTLKELYKSFRDNGLSQAESAFNALYLWCYDNYYSSGVPVKNKYKNIYAHPTSWFKNAHHLWRHNKWSVAVRILDIFPTIKGFFGRLSAKHNSTTNDILKTMEYDKHSAKKALNMFISLLSAAGIVFMVFIFQGATKNFKMVPALSLYVDGKHVGEVLSISDVETAKNSIENSMSINTGSSFKLDCLIEYKAARITKGSNLTQARLGRALSEVAHKQMMQGYGLYAQDVLIAVSESKAVLDDCISESIENSLTDEQKNDESIERVSFLNLTVREGSFPKSKFNTEEEIRQMFSLTTDKTVSSDETADTSSEQDTSADSNFLPVLSTNTLLPVDTDDATTTSDIQMMDSNEALLHQIAIETAITKIETTTEVVPFSTVCVGYDENLVETKETIVTRGVAGSKTASYIVEYVGEIEVSRRLISEVILTEPVTQEIIKGSRPLSEEEKRVKSTGTYVYPSQGELSSEYGWRTWGSYNEFHKGLDMRSDQGLVLVASDGGEVIQAADMGDGYGKCILIRHDDGTITRYAHCSNLYVEEGQKVAQNEYIADMGATGWVTGVHIHFEIIKDGVTVNPKDYLIPRE
ncbi:MAG: hypothetical protein E7600_07835 [Ruminococcaceae bacterium]|nr:hypothetical protein [Oscillospiraceae bacterium]